MKKTNENKREYYFVENGFGGKIVKMYTPKEARFAENQNDVKLKKVSDVLIEKGWASRWKAKTRNNNGQIPKNKSFTFWNY